MRSFDHPAVRPAIIGLVALLLVAGAVAVGVRAATPEQEVGTGSAASLLATSSAPASSAVSKSATSDRVARATGGTGFTPNAGIRIRDLEPLEPPPPPPEPAYAMYKGLGSWVDIWDEQAWADPAATVRDMAGHGVRTIYIETANSGASSAFVHREGLETFVREAHARKMKVVSWYLCDMLDANKDWDRIKQAVVFKTADGQSFDSFALDIESDKVTDAGQRNSRLLDLSAKLRDIVGKEYPLGAIIPSPVGISTNAAYWPNFPYESLAKTYDVFVPMSYYTYHGSGGVLAYEDTMSNVRILRGQPGCADTPIHLIGGIAEDSSDTEVRQFVRAANETKVYGASFYSWPGTTDAHWTQLGALK